MATILVVEDHADTRTALERVLRYAGFEAVAVDNGHDALELMRIRLPAAVILDCNLPGMCGTEILRQMQLEKPMRKVPVIMYSADISIETRDQALQGGAVEFLVKGTVGWPALIEVVKKYAGDPSRD